VKGRLRPAPPIALCGLAIGACIVLPPADPVSWPDTRPAILHGSVVPPADDILTQLPSDGTLLLPIELDDADESFQYELFVDYAAAGCLSLSSCPSLVGQGAFSPSLTAKDGGIMVIGVSFDTDVAQVRLATPFCHRIEVVVGRTFAAVHVPASPGGDSITWLYDADGTRQACPFEDAATAAEGGGDGGAEEDAARAAQTAVEAGDSAPTADGAPGQQDP